MQNIYRVEIAIKGTHRPVTCHGQTLSNQYIKACKKG